MKLFFGLIFLCSMPLYGMGLNCDDPDMVLCLELNEGNGLVANDYSRSGLTADLVGGPAWTKVTSNRRDLGNFSTNTMTNMSSDYITFTRTAGENVTTRGTFPDFFSGTKGFMVAFVFKNDGIGPLLERSIINCNTPVGGAGFTIDLDNRNFLKVAYTPVGNKNFSAFMPVPQNKDPHSVGIFWDGATQTLLEFYDGKLSETHTGLANPLTPADPLNIAAAYSGVQEFGGAVAHVRIWDEIVPKHMAESFFLAYHNMFIGTD